MYNTYISSDTTFSGCGRISKYYHLVVDFCIPLFFHSRGDSVTVHVPEHLTMNPTVNIEDYPEDYQSPGNLSNDRMFEIINYIFKDIKFVPNHTNNHSDIWMKNDQKKQLTLPEYINVENYKLLKHSYHRGVWSNHPVCYYDTFREHINSLFSDDVVVSDVITIVVRGENTSEPRTNQQKDHLHELYNMYTQQGQHVKMVDFAEMTFVDSIRLCRATKLLITTHGAALSNIVFMKPGSTVHELGHVQLPCFEILANQCGINYKHITVI